MKYAYGPVTYYEGIAPCSMSFSRLAVAGDKEAPYGGCFGGRTSDNPHGTIGLMGIAIHDSPMPTANGWSLYTEDWLMPGSHRMGVCMPEFAIINKRGECTDVDPYHCTDYGQVNAHRLGIGKPGAEGGEISCGQIFLSAETTGKAVARIGHVIAESAVKFVNGIAKAWNFARGHALQWWAPDGPTSFIVCTTAGKDYACEIDIGNSAIHFRNAVTKEPHFSFDLIDGVFYMGAKAVGPNGTIRLWAGGQPYLIKATPEKTK